MVDNSLIHYSVFLDTTPLRCPNNMLALKQTVKKATHGEIILVKLSDSSFILDCQVFARQTGHNLLQSWEDNNIFYVTIQKNGSTIGV